MSEELKAIFQEKLQKGFIIFAFAYSPLEESYGPPVGCGQLIVKQQSVLITLKSRPLPLASIIRYPFMQSLQSLLSHTFHHTHFF